METNDELSSPTLPMTVAQARKSLTPRDIQVARMTALGYERNTIAARLGLSRSAVNRHMAKMFKLTGAINGANLIAVLATRGILGPGGGRVSQVGDAGVRASRIVRSAQVQDPNGDVDEHVNAVLRHVADRLQNEL